MKKRETIVYALMMLTTFVGFNGCNKQDTSPGNIGIASETNPFADELIQATADSNTRKGTTGIHYELNIIGVPKGKTVAMTKGSHIFVSLSDTTKIMVNEGNTFTVTDANGTDGSAVFQLPNPDPSNSGITTYTVYSRAIGSPGGSGSISTCATDPKTGLIICSNLTHITLKGKKLTNVSAELLYIYADIDGDGIVERYPLFDSRLENYFWNYDPDGLKVLQLRFYPKSIVK